jgi:flagellar assembly factor FliW
MTMKAKTRLFGEIDIADDKIITLEKGMIGFPALTHFALIFDEEKQRKHISIMWLQSMDDPDVAFPVLDPHTVKADYTPNVNAEIVEPLGEMTDENTYVLVTVTVPRKVEDFSVNLKAPVVINMDTLKGVQMIVEDDYPVKYKVYEILKAQKEKAGE